MWVVKSAEPATGTPSRRLQRGERPWRRKRRPKHRADSGPGLETQGRRPRREPPRKAKLWPAKATPTPKAIKSAWSAQLSALAAAYGAGRNRGGDDLPWPHRREAGQEAIRCFPSRIARIVQVVIATRCGQDWCPSSLCCDRLFSLPWFIAAPPRQHSLTNYRSRP